FGTGPVLVKGRQNGGRPTAECVVPGGASHGDVPLRGRGIWFSDLSALPDGGRAYGDPYGLALFVPAGGPAHSSPVVAFQKVTQGGPGAGRYRDCYRPVPSLEHLVQRSLGV